MFLQVSPTGQKRRVSYLRKKKKRFCESLRETETEVTVVDENEVEGSDKENEQEEQTEPVNVVEQTDEEDS